MSFAFFSQGLGSGSWALVGDIVPPGMLGVVGGVVNFAGNLSGIVTPIAVGFIVKVTGTFTWALVLLAAIAVAGALCYVFLLGEVRQIEFADSHDKETEAVG
jgi:MFS transporter, ACS family, D-galactonate transporter